MALSFDTPITTNDQSIDRVLAAGLPVILVFMEGAGTDALNQMLSKLARENAGQVLIAKIPAKDNPESTRRYQVSASPAVVAVRAGQVISKAERVSAQDLERHTAYLLGKGPRPENTQPRPEPRAAQGAQPPADDGQPRIVTDATFEQEVLRSSQPVLVDFWAPWCAPCRMTDPIVEKLAREMAGRLRVAKVNVDENPAVAQKYGVYSIPTMMVVKNGQIADRWAGALPEPALRSRVASQVRE